MECKIVSLHSIHEPPLLEVKNLVKQFGNLTANDHINLHIQGSRIHALLGENGAGKSTLVKMVYGALQPTSGEILWQGERVIVDSPARARELGIGMVFQHFSLFEALTVAENISLALPANLREGNLEQRISELSHDYGLPLQPDALVADLSVGERQRIEIVRCLLQQPRLLIMDEPTAVLTPQEAQSLFTTLQRLTSEGCAVLYISHRLEEVKQICHGATILRHGKIVAPVDPQIETAASLAQMMVGAEVHAVSHGTVAASGQPLIIAEQFSQAADTPFGVDLKAVNLQVRAGEILAIAGVAGNGQSELFAALSGEQTNSKPQAINMCGQACGHLGITQRRRIGAAFIPEERMGHSAVANFSLSDNIILSRHSLCDNHDQQSLVGRSGTINYTLARDINMHIGKVYDVRKGQPDPEAGSLSGGNLQKFVMGRELDRRPKVLVVNQPTWGVDAGAAALIRQALIDLARSGSALIVISQDLDEIFELADQISVISRGYLSPAQPAQSLSAEQIGLLMAGAHETSTQAQTL
jgi:ABC-type uncharacterized transport system ATPase subunit